MISNQEAQPRTTAPTTIETADWRILDLLQDNPRPRARILSAVFHDYSILPLASHVFDFRHLFAAWQRESRSRNDLAHSHFITRERA